MQQFSKDGHIRGIQHHHAQLKNQRNYKQHSSIKNHHALACINPVPGPLYWATRESRIDTAARVSLGGGSATSSRRRRHASAEPARAGGSAEDVGADMTPAALVLIAGLPSRLSAGEGGPMRPPGPYRNA